MQPRACIAACLFVLIQWANGEGGYYGKYIGPLGNYHHGVSGEVYAVDQRTLHIRSFTYDGEGPAAYFYVGNTKTPGVGGIRVRDETGSLGVLKRYNKKHITLTLPEGKSLSQMKWFSVWCDEFSVNFGDIKFPRGMEYPKPQKIGSLAGVHGVSSDPIVVVDAQTLLVPSFSYDGEAPDAKFWVGRGAMPSPQGIRVPDENGKQTPLRQYQRKTIVLTLPGDLTVYDIDYFGVWCEAFTVDFGHVKIPQGLDVPPSLKMLGVSPQSKLNCEVLSDDLAFEVRWAVAGDSVVIQLVAKLEDGEYMSFGLSGSPDRSAMVGADVVVAWVDQATMNGYAVDYFLDAKSQCAGTRGSCPDTKIQGKTESVRLLNAALVNGYSIVTYQRPLSAHDALDLPIRANGSQPVIWAVGPLNSKAEVSYHSITNKDDIFIDFGRPPRWNCPVPDMDPAVSASHDQPARPHHQEKSKVIAPPAAAPRPKGAWDIPPIQCNEPDDGVFYAQMGPTGGKRGYPAITGHVGWGISYYINGLLIPEINVVRGKTYTFVVEGGNNPDIPAKFHPFYITDDPVGGYLYKTPEERRKVKVFAGVEWDRNNEARPTGVGRLCNWTPDPEEPMADDFASFGAYQRTLTLVCDHGEPGIVQWTPDQDTPDTVYYQCFSHRYLGWKINVLDRCDLPGAEQPDEPYSRPSIRVATRVRPDPQTLGTVTKTSSKGGFPYEIVKPSPEETSKVIPVNEESDEPTTTPGMPPMSRYNVSNIENQPPPVEGPNSMEMDLELPAPPPPSHMMQPHAVPPPPPIRVGYNRLPPMLMRPKPPKMPLMARPPQRPPPMIKKPIVRLPPPPPRPVVMMQYPRPMPPRVHPKPLIPHKQHKPMPEPPKPQQGMPQQVMMMKQHSVMMESQPQPPVQMMAQSSEEAVTRMPIAVNTGFNPGSLVIEGGFKPIIPDRAQERVDYNDDAAPEDDIGVIRLDPEPEISQGRAVISEQQEGGQEATSQTQMFEPMFIPSPLDSSLKSKKPTTSPAKKLRKPVRRPITRTNLEADERFYVPPNAQYTSSRRNPFAERRVPDIVVGIARTDVRAPMALALEAEPPSEKEEEEKVEVEETESKREKRDAYHDHGDHDHSMHDHSMHDHSMHDHSGHNHSEHMLAENKGTSILPSLLLLLPAIFLI